MRVLTVLSGILFTCAGAICLAYNTYAFSDLAFLMGIFMVLAGVFCLISYFMSGKGIRRLPDTLLVEAAVTILFGFAVLNNQVLDSQAANFFGTWLTLCGASRLSQSVAISRFDPKDWVKVLPLAAISTILGVIMLMTNLIATLSSMVLIGAAYIFNGLSIIMYAMYMQVRLSKEQKKQVAERAEAKKIVAKKRREQRKALRNLSEKEREEAQKEERRLKKEKDKAKKEARQAAKDAKRNIKEKTLKLTDEEAEAISKAAAEADAKEAAEETESIEDKAKVSFKVPENIPSLRANTIIEELPTDDVAEVKHSAINLDDIENANPEMFFDPVELPEVEFASAMDDTNVSRNELLEELSKEIANEADYEGYTPVDLEELLRTSTSPSQIAETKDNLRFSEVFDFKWDADKQ